MSVPFPKSISDSNCWYKNVQALWSGRQGSLQSHWSLSFVLPFSPQKWTPECFLFNLSEFLYFCFLSMTNFYLAFMAMIRCHHPHGLASPDSFTPVDYPWFLSPEIEIASFCLSWILWEYEVRLMQCSSYW